MGRAAWLGPSSEGGFMREVSEFLGRSSSGFSWFESAGRERVRSTSQQSALPGSAGKGAGCFPLHIPLAHYVSVASPSASFSVAVARARTFSSPTISRWPTSKRLSFDRSMYCWSTIPSRCASKWRCWKYNERSSYSELSKMSVYPVPVASRQIASESVRF